MGRQIDIKGVKARSSSILIDLRSIGYKQVTLSIEPTQRNLLFAARTRQEILEKHAKGTLKIEEYFEHLTPQRDGTYNEWADQWLSIIAPNIAQTTLSEYRNALSRFREAFGDRPIDRITPADIVTMLATIDLTAKSFNNIISPFRASLALAFKLGKINSDLSEHITQRRKEQTDGPDPLSAEEIDRFLGSAGDWRPYFEFAVYTGMRPSELIALKWGDIDLTQRTVTVRSSRVRGIDKGTKTSAVRTIRLPDRAHAALVRQRPISGLGEKVWIHPVSLTPFADTQPPSDAWKRISKLAGIRARDARQTRHTYATLMLMAGVKPGFVAKQMGHATAQMFYKTYSRWLESDDDWREIDKLEFVTGNVTKEKKAQ